MAAKHDAQIGLHATVHGTDDQILPVLSRAATVLGDRAETTTRGNKVTVRIRPGLVKALSSTSPIVGMTVSSANADGACSVIVKIESYRTVQTKFMLLIPVGPKRLVGKSSYLNLLASVEQELRALDSDRLQVVRMGAVGR